MRARDIVNGVTAKFGLEVRRRTIPRRPQFSAQTPPYAAYRYRLLELIHGIEGDIVECGVGRGVSMLNWCALSEYSQKYQDEPKWPERKIWGFDSFEGLPEPTAEDLNVEWENAHNIDAGTISDTSRLGVLKMMEQSGISAKYLASSVELRQGWFEKSLPGFNTKIALLHIDVDLHDSYEFVLRELFDQVVPGGVIAFDEYKNRWDLERFPGAAIAIDNFFDDKAGAIVKDEFLQKWFYVKPSN